MSTLKDYLRPRLWDELRSFGSSRAMRLTVFVPILGYYILFGQWFNEALTLVFEDKFDLSRAYFLYYSFWALAIGSVLYAWLCPHVVNKYTDKYEYRRNESGLQHEVYIGFLRSELTRDRYNRGRKGQRWPPYDQASEDILTPGALQPEEAEKLLSSVDAVIDRYDEKELFFHYYDFSRRRYSAIRALVAYLYTGGMLVLAWTSLRVLWQVTEHLIATQFSG